MNNYSEIFRKCKTTAEIKKLYRELAMKHHPDRGGNTAVMQSINSAYHAALESHDGTAERGRTATMRPARRPSWKK